MQIKKSRPSFMRPALFLFFSFWFYFKGSMGNEMPESSPPGVVGSFSGLQPSHAKSENAKQRVMSKAKNFFICFIPFFKYLLIMP
jgi:hypothetical protein